MTGSSLFMFHFPYKDDVQLDRPKDIFDPAVCDVTLNKDASQLALLLEDIYVIHGHGAISTAHTEADINSLGEACRQVARRVWRSRAPGDRSVGLESPSVQR